MKTHPSNPESQLLEIKQCLSETREIVGTTRDALPCPGFGMKDVHRGAVKDYLTRAGQRTGTGVPTLLTILNLSDADRLLNGAALLFARTPLCANLK